MTSREADRKGKEDDSSNMIEETWATLHILEVETIVWKLSFS